MTRDEGGKLVCETWVKYVLETVDDPKHSHIVPWGDMLSELDKEADRRIADAVLVGVGKEIHRLRQHLHAIHGGICENADELRLRAKQALEGEVI